MSTKRLWFNRAAILVIGLALISYSAVLAVESMTAKSQKTIERGKYLVLLGGCNDCHSPKVFTQMGPKPDTTRLLSGAPAAGKVPQIPGGVLAQDKWGFLGSNDMTTWVGPWGVSFAANLTPDKKTGLGNIDAATFIKAMRTGKHFGVGRDILPPMPWPSLAQVGDDDLNAIFAYLQSLPPVTNRVPDPMPPAMK